MAAARFRNFKMPKMHKTGIRQLRSWVLLDKSWARASNLVHILETVLEELDDGSRRKDCIISIFGDELFCAKCVRNLHLIQDMGAQYLMLELIICGLRLCISGKIYTLQASAFVQFNKHCLSSRSELSMLVGAQQTLGNDTFDKPGRHAVRTDFEARFFQHRL
jgi:hypothetical protein